MSIILKLSFPHTETEMADIRTRFTSQRSQLPPCFIATPLHRDSSPLTSPSPSFPVFHWICLLAKESLSVLSSQLMAPDLPTTDIKASDHFNYFLKEVAKFFDIYVFAIIVFMHLCMSFH